MACKKFTIASPTATGPGGRARPPAPTTTTAAEKSAQKPSVKPGNSAPGTRSTSAPEFNKSDNNYRMEGSNYITSPEIKPFEKLNLNFDFVPNILDNYDVCTYHWKLFLTTQDASSTGEVFNPDSQIIIAETGVSDLTIDNVVIESIATPSVDSGTGTSTTLKFDIIEPAGAGLIDKIFYQSLALGIGNWNVMPFYLELTFKGRNPVTSEVDDGSPGSMSSLKWLWTLKLSEMKANVTHVGTKYEVAAIVYNELAQTNAYFTVPHTTVIENLSKFDNAMAKLQKTLNDDQLYRLIDTVSIPDTYKIVVDPKLAGYTITPPTHNTDSQRNDSVFDFNGKNATFPAATSVDKIIDTLLAQTSEAQELIKNSPTPGADGVPANQEISQMKKFWRIITESRPLKYDPRQNNYAREFTIFIVQYDIGVLDTNIFQDSAKDKSIETERKRLATYLQKSILKKKYNYIFTGLNDQVYNFDIKINNAFASAQARMGGIYYNAAMADIGVVYQSNSSDLESVTSQLQKTISFLNTASTTGEDRVLRENAISQMSSSIDAAKLRPGDAERFRTILNTAKSPDRSVAIRAIQNAGGIDQDGQLTRTPLEARDIATPIQDRTTNQNLRFISDININSKESKAAYTDYIKGIKGKLRPVARIDNMHQRQIGMGIESSSNPGIQKLSSIFSVAMHSTQDVSFAKIKLDIKGDPFWLFPQPISTTGKIFNSLKPPSEAIEWIKNAHRQVRDAVNITGTDNFIMLRFRTPRVYELDEQAKDDTNSLIDVETLSGVFKVVTITSKFAAGRFTQELNCLMDYQINLLNFTEEIEAISKLPDVPVKPSDLLPKIAEDVKSNTKGQRVLGKVDVPGVQSEFAVGANVFNNPINSIGTQLGANIPISTPNLLAGLPPRFIDFT